MKIEEIINNSEYNSFDSLENIPPPVIFQTWFEGVVIPTYDESQSIFLAAQFLYSFLELYCPLNNTFDHELGGDDNVDHNDITPLKMEEANNLRNLSVSIQIYCERVRLLFFSELSSAAYNNHYCQFCGNCNTISPINPLRIVCSSCLLAIDVCMYTFLPIKLIPPGEDVIKKCLVCSACVNSKYIQSQSLSFTWIPSNFSTLLCLFCSASMVDLFE